MGYTTEFDGYFELSRPLTQEEKTYIQLFNRTRRMKRNVEELHKLYNGKHGNPAAETHYDIYGHEGEFFVGGPGDFGQGRDSSIIEFNTPPGQPVMAGSESFAKWMMLRDDMVANGKAQPGLWCQWTVDEAGTRLEWDGGEKFYEYVPWLKYLINNFFSKWGVQLNGIVYWEGEDSTDKGKIIVDNNHITTKVARVVYD